MFWGTILLHIKMFYIAYNLITWWNLNALYWECKELCTVPLITGWWKYGGKKVNLETSLCFVMEYSTFPSEFFIAKHNLDYIVIPPPENCSLVGQFSRGRHFFTSVLHTKFFIPPKAIIKKYTLFLLFIVYYY
jgi:hypothetical protein